MGFIKEPKNVEFYVIDKPWTNKERKEFSDLISQKKFQLKKHHLRKEVSKTTKEKLDSQG